MAAAEPKNSKIGIYTRLSRVLAEIGNVPKNGFNEHFKYSYVMESDLADHIRPLLVKHGLGLIYDCVEVSDRIMVNDRGKTVNLVRVKVAITIGAEDSEGNLIGEKTGHAYGEAADSGDKAIYKAMTGAVKYWLYKTFLVSTGDDPEQGNDLDREAAKTDPEVARRTKDWTAFQEDVAMMDTLTVQDFFDDFVAKNRGRMEASVYKGNYARYIKQRRDAFKDFGQQRAA
jgi:hypothetical protein